MKVLRLTLKTNVFLLSSPSASPSQLVAGAAAPHVHGGVLVLLLGALDLGGTARHRLEQDARRPQRERGKEHLPGRKENFLIIICYATFLQVASELQCLYLYFYVHFKVKYNNNEYF